MSSFTSYGPSNPEFENLGEMIDLSEEELVARLEV